MKNNKNDKKLNGSMVQLNNKRYVHLDILDYVRFVVQERIPALSTDKPCSLREIFPKDKWEDMTKMEKIEAGWCMAHLVKTGELPLRPAKGKGDNHRRYQLISTQPEVLIS